MQKEKEFIDLARHCMGEFLNTGRPLRPVSRHGRMKLESRANLNRGSAQGPGNVSFADGR